MKNNLPTLKRAAKALNEIRKFANTPHDKDFREAYSDAWWEVENTLHEIRSIFDISMKDLLKWLPQQTRMNG